MPCTKLGYVTYKRPKHLFGWRDVINTAKYAMINMGVRDEDWGPHEFDNMNTTMFDCFWQRGGNAFLNNPMQFVEDWVRRFVVDRGTTAYQLFNWIHSVLLMLELEPLREELIRWFGEPKLKERWGYHISWILTKRQEAIEYGEESR